MKTMFGGNAQFKSIFFLLQTFAFSTKILLGETKDIEALFNVRYERSSNNYNTYLIYTDFYQLFQGVFFNKTITSIKLHYNNNGQDNYIDDILCYVGETQFNGTFHTCLHVPNISSIQCQKHPGSMDLLSGICTRGTGIVWIYNDEYLHSKYFKNETLNKGNDSKLVCYTLLDNTGSSLPPDSNTTKNSSALSSGAIAGILISIVIVIIAIVIIVVILWRRKHNTDTKSTTISHMQSTNTTNAYNQQVLDTRGHNNKSNAHLSSSNSDDDPYMEISNDESQINDSYTETDPGYVGIDKDYSVPVDAKCSTIESSKDDYTYIVDTAEIAQTGSIDDGYSTLGQTIKGLDESVEHRQGKSHARVPNYNNVDVVIADDTEKAGRKKDVYSKLGEKKRLFQNDYGELNGDSHNEEIKDAHCDSEDVNRNKEKDRRKEVYSKLREKNVNFQNTYGEENQGFYNGEEEIFPELEVNNTYFELETGNPKVYTFDPETS